MAKLDAMSLRILKVMQDHPEGITEGEIRAVLQIPAEEQCNFGRRRRELNAIYDIQRRREGKRTLYLYNGPREEHKDTISINNKTRAHILHLAKGRCGMCGMTIEKHGIDLHVDHRIPRDLGGRTELENLWAICELCNSGKKNHFETIASPGLLQAMNYKSVHMKLGEALKAAAGEPVGAEILHIIADQDDWKKRIRELKYLGWKVKATKKKTASGRVSVFYTLLEHQEWPDDPTGFIRGYEKDRATRNRREKV